MHFQMEIVLCDRSRVPTPVKAIACRGPVCSTHRGQHLLITPGDRLLLGPFQRRRTEVQRSDGSRQSL